MKAQIRAILNRPMKDFERVHPYEESGFRLRQLNDIRAVIDEPERPARLGLVFWLLLALAVLGLAYLLFGVHLPSFGSV